MTKKPNSIAIIGYLLVAYYAVRMITEFLKYTSTFQWTSMFWGVLFLGAVVAAMGVAQMKQSCRPWLVKANGMIIGVSLFFMIFYKQYSPADIVLAVFTAWYFEQSRVKLLFSDKLGLQRKSVLIIDDDPALIKTIKPVLLTNGFSVLTAMTGEKGIQVAKKQKPDLIVLDVILPGIKGREVCSRLKADSETDKIPVIFLTAKDSPDDVEAEIAAGGLSHITKPFSTQKLLEEIRKALGE